MSNYQKVTRHPFNGKYEVAQWLDDYFAPHVYGVQFSDGKVYPVDMVEKAQIKTFWADDVVEGVRSLHMDYQDADAAALELLTAIDEQYNARWERDPIGGGGSIEQLRGLLGLSQDTPKRK